MDKIINHPEQPRSPKVKYEKRNNSVADFVCM